LFSILDVEEKVEKPVTSLKTTEITFWLSDVSADIFHGHVCTICNGDYRSGLVIMWTRYACFRQDIMDAVRGRQLRIIGFHCRSGIFGLSERLFFSKGRVFYGICFFEKTGNL
jgi:hypothetical protein